MKPCKIVVCLLFASFSLNAQNDSTRAEDFFDLSLEELMNLQVTTATKTSGKSDVAPAVIEIITAEQIKSRGYQHLAHILNDIPNNHEDRSNWGIGEPTNQNVGFGFRFDTGQNILILFNGQRLNAFLPGNRFGGEEYLLNNVDRIEIIRGPGSALYGTGAFTSVVNIITKSLATNDKNEIALSGEIIPTSRGATVSASTIQRINQKANLNTAVRYFKESGQLLHIKNSLFGDAHLRDGVNHAVDAEIVLHSKSFNVSSKLTNQSRKTFTGFNGVNPHNIDELNLDMYAYSIGADKNVKISKNTEVKVSAGWHQDKWEEVGLIPQFKLTEDGTRLLTDESGKPVLDTLTIFRDGRNVRTPFFKDGQGAHTRSLDAEVQLTSNYYQGNHLVLGMYISQDKIIDAARKSELNIDPLMNVPFTTMRDPGNNWLFDVNAARNTIAGYAQVDYNITSAFNVSAGARLDFYTGTGSLSPQKYRELNPRAAAVYSINDRSTLKLLFGTATRIPNGFETLSSVSILGTPLNTPERIATTQFQWIANWSKNLRTEIGGFHSAISNRLETNANISDELKARGFIGQFVNSAAQNNQRNQGIDAKCIARVSSSTINVNFTQYFRSDDGHGHPIAYIPNTMLNVDYTCQLRNISLNTGMNYRAGFTKSVFDEREVVKNYLVARTNIIYQPAKSSVSYKLNVRNMFNSNYAYPSSSTDFAQHFPARGIELTIGFMYQPTSKYMN